jgi:hypothetical protein
MRYHLKVTDDTQVDIVDICYEVIDNTYTHEAVLTKLIYHFLKNLDEYNGTNDYQLVNVSIRNEVRE